MDFSNNNSPLQNVSRRFDWVPLLLIGLMSVLWTVLHFLTGVDLFGPTAYPTYTLQAMAWRSGMLHLDHNYAWLELAVFGGEYYVSFPPLPSVVLLPLTFIFGFDTPDNLLVKLYASGACLILYFALKRQAYGRVASAALAFLIVFGSSLLPVTMDGAVWYHAQTLAFLFVTSAIACVLSGHVTPGLFFYALSVGCRPFDAIYALPLFFVFCRAQRRNGIPYKQIIRKLLPGIGLGLLVACALGAYNFARFGNPFEFGHNYLPEFSTQGGVQFSLSHLPENIKTFLFGLPLEFGNDGVHFARFGYSMLIACPIITLTLIRGVWDLFQRRMTPGKAVTLVTMILLLFLLLLHRTFGGFQLGARYAADAIPFCALYTLLDRPGKRWTVFQIIVLSLSLLFTCWGFCQVHL